MNISQAVARVYAEALIDLAEAGKADLGRIVDDLLGLHALWDDASFREFFGSPRLDPAAKKRILSEVLGGQLERPVMGLLHVLVDKRREMVLDNIIAEFERFRDIRENRIHAHVTCAAKLAPDQRDELKAKLERQTGKTVVMHEKVDPKVLGGLIVKVGDRVLDGSLRRKLGRLRQILVAAS